MSLHRSGGGKLPGKTKYAGRRREMTRSSGFTVHAETTGGEFRRRATKAYKLKRGQCIEITFRIAGHAKGDLLGYGAWFCHSGGVACSVTGGPDRRTLTAYDDGSWNKVGSMWAAASGASVEVVFRLCATAAAEVSVDQPVCGRVSHKHLNGARPELLRNMYQFAPEAVFVTAETGSSFADVNMGVLEENGVLMAAEPTGSYGVTPKGSVERSTIATLSGTGIEVDVPEDAVESSREMIVKSCNRCGRYLPVNIDTERDQLSFSNHCVAEHRRPCKHATFGKLRNVDRAGDVLQLDYGFQLECRFCKKFEVNAAHNPQRTTAQMKEDGARRRAFELLLAELYEGTPQLRYRHEHGSELADDVWSRFSRKCFNCGTKLPSARDMHLDHTRPLALMWPLDGTATALCGPCNSEKRDRAPADFYSVEQLDRLAQITGISKEQLRSVRPNDEALGLLLERFDWFFGEFLMRDEMTKERDGKVTGELVVKALQKVFARSAMHRGVDLAKEYEKRRARTRR